MLACLWGKTFSPSEQRTLVGVVGQGKWLGATDFHSYVLSYVRYRATYRAGNHSSLRLRDYCEHLEEKAGCSCQG